MPFISLLKTWLYIALILIFLRRDEIFHKRRRTQKPWGHPFPGTLGSQIPQALKWTTFFRNMTSLADLPLSSLFYSNTLLSPQDQAAFASKAFCFPQTRHGHVRRQIRTEHLLPELPQNDFRNPARLSWWWRQSEEGEGRSRGVSAPERWPASQVTCDTHPQSRRDPSLAALSSWGQLISGSCFHHLPSKQQKGSCKSHWKCKNAYSYPQNLVPGKQLKGNSILGYGLHE